MLRMYDVGGKSFNGIKYMYTSSIACVGVKGVASQCFRIVSGAKQRYVISPWLFTVYIDAVTKKVKIIIKG